jgi:uncharacterized protein
MNDRHNVIVQVFAKAPEPGKVKTRLIPLLGEQGAATLYRSLATRTLETAREASVGPVELWCVPDIHHDFFSFCRARYNVTLHQQCDGNLGLRMHKAIEEGLARARHVVLIGSDCPSLTATDVQAAAAVLREGYDAVFGPTEDGGYVLVGLNSATPTAFDAMTWGTAQVMDETRRRLRRLGRRWHELPTQWDVDRPEDYRRLISTYGDTPRNTESPS